MRFVAVETEDRTGTSGKRWRTAMKLRSSALLGALAIMGTAAGVAGQQITTCAAAPMQPLAVLGVTGFACTDCEFNSTDQVMVFRVAPRVTALAETRGAENGLRQDDVLLAVDEAEITTAAGLRVLRTMRPGRQVDVRVRRDGRPRTVVVTSVACTSTAVSPLPVPSPEQPPAPPVAVEPAARMRVAPLPAPPAPPVQAPGSRRSTARVTPDAEPTGRGRAARALRSQTPPAPPQTSAQARIQTPPRQGVRSQSRVAPPQPLARGQAPPLQGVRSPSQGTPPAQARIRTSPGRVTERQEPPQPPAPPASARIVAPPAPPLAPQVQSRRIVPSERMSISSVLAQAYLGIGLRCERCTLTLQRDGTSLWAFTENPVILSVDPDSPADRAGLRSGDVLLTIDGDAFTSEAGARRFSEIEPGETVRFTYRRSGRTATATLVAAERQGSTELAESSEQRLLEMLRAEQDQARGAMAQMIEESRRVQERDPELAAQLRESAAQMRTADVERQRTEQTEVAERLAQAQSALAQRGEVTQEASAELLQAMRQMETATAQQEAVLAAYTRMIERLSSVQDEFSRMDQQTPTQTRRALQLREQIEVLQDAIREMQNEVQQDVERAREEEAQRREEAARLRALVQENMGAAQSLRASSDRVRYAGQVGDASIEVRGGPGIITRIVREGAEIVIVTSDGEIRIRRR